LAGTGASAFLQLLTWASARGDQGHRASGGGNQVAVNKILVAALTLPILAHLATDVAAAEGKPLTASEMQALLSNGLTIGIMDVNGGTKFRGSVTINADGTQSGSLLPTGQSPIALSGSWKLKGAKFCRVLRPVSDKEVCETWVKTGDKQITVMIGAKPAGLNILP
jgi:hypothetical protein